jgi:tetratricopeptide (TPR) repeat protein
MSISDDLESELRAKLPSNLYALIPHLIDLLTATTRGQLSTTELQRILEDDSSLVLLFRILKNQPIVLENINVVSVLDSQTGQVRIVVQMLQSPTKHVNVNTDGGDYAEGNIDKRQGQFFVGGIHIHQEAPVSSTPLPPPLTRPPRTSGFVGRKEKLAYYETMLKMEHLAIITGMAGIGKTALATALAERVGIPQKTFWYSFGEGDDIEVIVKKLAAFLAQQGQDGLWRQLHSSGQPQKPKDLLDYLIPLISGQEYLLCLDDFHNVTHDAWLERFIDQMRAELQDGRISLIITSRHKPELEWDVDFESLSGLEDGDIRTLLEQRSVTLPDDAIDALISATQGNAQLIILAINALRRSQNPALLAVNLLNVDNIERFLLDEVDQGLTEDERAVMNALSALLGYPSSREAVAAVLKPETETGTVGADQYSHYEIGIRQLRMHIPPDHPRVTDLLVYQQRLTENISQSRLYGNSETRTAERAEVIHRLNELALALLGQTFNDICGPIIHPKPQEVGKRISELRMLLADLSNRNLLIVTEDNDARRKYVQHAIVQTFYYDGIEDQAELRALHRRAGTYYETAKNDERDPLKAGRHFERAEEYARAAKLITSNFWTLMNQGQARALRQVLERFTAQQLEAEQWVSISIARAEVYGLLGESQPAQVCYQEALAVLDRASDTPAIRERKARVYRGLSVISERNGLGKRAESECQSGLELMTNVELPNLEVARLQAQLAEVLFLRSNYDDTESACRKGLTALPPEPAAPRERALLYQRLATVDGQRNKYREAIAALEHSLILAYQVNDPALIARILNNLGAYLNYAGQKDQALEYYEKCLEFRKKLGDIRGRAITLINQGGVYQERGEYKAAMERFVESRNISTRLNLPDRWATAELNIGIVQFLQEHLDEARESFLQAEASFRKLNNKNYVASCLFRLGDVALAQHDPNAAKGYGEQSLVLAQEVGSAAYEFSALRVIFEALLAQERLDQAAEYLEQARSVHEKLRTEASYGVRVLISSGRLALVRKDYDYALAQAHSALEIAREQNNPHLINLAKQVCADIERERNQ